MPADTSVMIGKSDLYILPVGVDGNADQVVASFFFIVSGESYGKGPGIPGHGAVVAVNAVSAQRLHAADRIGKFFADNPVFMSVGDHKFEKFKKISVFLQQRPVYPGNFVILAITVVIADFRIAEFISGKKHRSSAAAH